MGFELDLDQTEVVLTAPQGGVSYKLKHILRQPTSYEWKEYDRRSASLHRGKAGLENNILEAREWLYNKVVQRLEGYTFQGGALSPDTPNWKDKVPVLHKSQVIGRLGEVYLEEDEGN